jgi:hypothetical protein
MDMDIDADDAFAIMESLGAEQQDKLVDTEFFNSTIFMLL